MADNIICSKCSAPNPRETAFCGKCGAKLIDSVAADGEAQDPLIGTLVGSRFLVHEVLGEGGMGRVYRAEQTAIKRVVALKVLHPHLTQDKSLHARFQNEAAAASRLTHPNTITIYDFGQIDSGSLYLAMEFIKGISLDDELITNGAMHWQRVQRIGIQICGSLQDAHDNAIVHRDMKPENVMLCERSGQQDVVKVLDFGIAKILEDENQDQRKALTKTGMVFGTPQYMSPEQIRGDKVDHRSDIYSVGVILYQMLTGELPFKSDTPMGVLTKHLMDEPPALETINPGSGIPAELEAVVMKTLAKEAVDRPSSMRELSQALVGISGAGPAKAAQPAAQPKPVQPQPDDASIGDTAELPTTEVPPEAVRRPGGQPAAIVKGTGGGRGKLIGIIAAAVLVLGGGGAAAWYFLAGPGQSKPRARRTNPPVAVTQPTQPVTQPQPGNQANLAPLPAVPGSDTQQVVLSDGTPVDRKPRKPRKPDKPPADDDPPDQDTPVIDVQPVLKDVACSFVRSKDPIAQAMIRKLRGSQKRIKQCVNNSSGGQAKFDFVVSANSSRPASVRLKSNQGKGVKDDCLKRVLQNDFGTTKDKKRRGTATFNLARYKGVLQKCNINVQAKTSSEQTISIGRARKRP